MNYAKLTISQESRIKKRYFFPETHLKVIIHVWCSKQCLIPIQKGLQISLHILAFQNIQKILKNFFKH